MKTFDLLIGGKAYSVDVEKFDGKQARVRVDGRVIDFIDFRIWPVFNFADSAIVCGMLVLLIHVLFHTPEKKDEGEEEKWEEEEENIMNIKEYKEQDKE